MNRLRKNEEIRRDYCKHCRLYEDYERRAHTPSEIYDCTVCYTQLRRGNKPKDILKRYKIEA